VFAKGLEYLLAECCGQSDVSPVGPADIAERFESLRGYGRLPRGRENRAKLLNSSEIAAAILGLVPTNPKWAGHAAVILSDLRPIGGPGASFFGAVNLSAATERLLTDSGARQDFLSLTLSVAESGVNSNGFATLINEEHGTRRHISFVSKMAVSQLQPGAEDAADVDQFHARISKCVVFNHAFFDQVATAVTRAVAFPAPPPGDGSEYDAEEAQQERYRKLGVRPGSQFLNIGVDNQVTWPKHETLVKFDRYCFVLMPKTRDHVQSIHVDLTANRLTRREAMTVINRFLSVMTWCDDQFAIAQDGWSGNPVPVPIPKRNLAFTTAYQWIFDRQIPSSEEARRALALYREGRNAQQNFLVSHAVLNFFRIIELKNDSRGAVKNWFRDNFEILKQDSNYGDEFHAFSTICGNEKPHEYIYKSCRIAVAHANKDSRSDPDDANEVDRLHKAVEVLRILARHFIAIELRVSDCMYSGE
jgi:hypothetical protein